MKYINLLLASACILLLCLNWQLNAKLKATPVVGASSPLFSANKAPATLIMSLEEIQQIIGAEPDGIYGAETREKWDKYLCNQYAAELSKPETYK